MSGTLIVTGGGRGIGAATATLAAHHGWNVCVGYHGDSQSAARVVTACQETGQRAMAWRVDIADETDVTTLFDQAADQLGPITGLVNNAGVVAALSTVAAMDTARIRRIFDVNALGAFLCAREAVRRMTPGGSIVNVSSRASTLGSPYEYVDYAAAKAAVDAMTIGLAREVAADGIRVNAVRPGLIDTGIHAPGRLAQRAPEIPMKRVGEPREVAETIVWLLSSAASYVTGALVDVSGGR